MHRSINNSYYMYLPLKWYKTAQKLQYRQSFTHYDRCMTKTFFFRILP